ncbi:MAG: hypothetical protein ACXAES_08590 [Promethearchaeota archaeon]
MACVAWVVPRRTGQEIEIPRVFNPNQQNIPRFRLHHQFSSKIFHLTLSHFRALIPSFDIPY